MELWWLAHTSISAASPLEQGMRQPDRGVGWRTFRVLLLTGVRVAVILSPYYVP